jgi:hypothetical protein
MGNEAVDDYEARFCIRRVTASTSRSASYQSLGIVSLGSPHLQLQLLLVLPGHGHEQVVAFGSDADPIADNAPVESYLAERSRLDFDDLSLFVELPNQGIFYVENEKLLVERDGAVDLAESDVGKLKRNAVHRSRRD